MSDLSAFSPAGNTATLAVTTVTGSVALTAKPGTAEITIIVQNVDTEIAFIALGTSTVTATTASMPIQPGMAIVLSTNYTQNTHLAAITSTGTTTLYVTSGTGIPYGFGGSAIAGGAGGQDVNVLSVIPGTGATNLGKAEDSPHTSGDVGVAALAVRNSAQVNLTNTDLDYSPQAVDAAGRPIISPSGATASATFTCGTTAYAANDVVGANGANAAISFPSLGPSGATVMITGASLEIDASAIISGETSYYLALYSVTPPSALNDSTAWDLPSGDRASFLGLVTIGSIVDLGSTLYVEVNGVNKMVTMAGTGLFAYLISAGAYTPTARVFVVKLTAAVI